MFNKNSKKIDDLNQKINGISKLISTLHKKEEINNKNINELIDTLGKKNFSRDWEDYQKYKLMKKKLPEIEDMYNLKNLKKYIIKINSLEKVVNSLEASYLTNKIKGWYTQARQVESAIIYINNQKNEYNKKINSIFNSLSKTNNKTELNDLFKLYAINTDWIKP